MPRLEESVISKAHLALCMVFCACLVATSIGAQDDCAEDWRVRRLDGIPGTSPDSGARTVIDVDIVDNARIASIIDGELWFAIIGTSPATPFRLERDGPVSSVSLATNERGVSTVAYTQQPDDDANTAQDVFLVETSGGSFTAPRLISDSVGTSREVCLALDRRGRPHIAWARSTVSSTEILYWNETMDSPAVAVDRGDDPALAIDHNGVVHIACVQRLDLTYVNNASGGFGEPDLVTRSPLVRESSVSVGALDDGTVLLAYESEGELYLSIREVSGDVLPPRRLAEGGVVAPRLSVEPNGGVLVVYTQEGRPTFLRGDRSELGDPRRIAVNGRVEGTPSLDVDEHSQIHASFIRDGTVSYATNACAPSASFSADPTTGPAPLTVQFTDASSGVTIRRWQWDFGDGTTSSLQNPTHVYDEIGEHTVQLTVWSGGGLSSRKVIDGLVVVEEPPYAFSVPDQQALAGTKSVWFPVLGTNAEPVEGFQIVGTYDPEFLTLVRSDLASTALTAGRIEAEFIETRIHETFFEIGVVLDFVPPFAGQELPPGKNQRLIHLVFDVVETAPQGQTTRVELVSDERLSPIRNILAVNGQARLPALSGSNVTIRPTTAPFPRPFVRGDFDGNGFVNLTDAVAALAFLFRSGSPPVCLDAGDVTDSGAVGISGIVALLNFLFTAGPAPAVPYPNPGLDPTDDQLGECLTSA